MAATNPGANEASHSEQRAKVQERRITNAIYKPVHSRIPTPDIDSYWRLMDGLKVYIIIS